MKDVSTRQDGDLSARRMFRQLLVTLAASTAICSVQAAPQGAEELGSTLTPLGGEVAANSNGEIPAWAAPGPQGEGWSYGQVRGEHWKFKDDKPLYSIDASSVAQYASKLSPGQLELFKKIPGYRMEVYPTRRTCGVPDFVAENTRQNLGFAKLDAEGVALEEAHVPGAPFPLPATGAEVMWNMKMRYRGLGVEIPRTISGVSPRKGGEWLRQSTDTFFFTPWGKKGSALFSSLGRLENATFFNYQEPAAQAGQSAVQTAVAGEQATTFYYFPGQRRVRRMPSYSYDAPQIGLDNQYTVDEANVFFGAMDRFDWKLIGKQELLVPYNAFGAYDTAAKVEAFAGDDSIAPQSRRYELHRVWVVEANVRQGMRHQAPKRLFYIDEDSWAAALGDNYDGKGQLWRTNIQTSVYAYEVEAFHARVAIYHDLLAGSYLADRLVNGLAPARLNDATFDASYFTAASLRKLGK